MFMNLTNLLKIPFHFRYFEAEMRENEESHEKNKVLQADRDRNYIDALGNSLTS